MMAPASSAQTWRAAFTGSYDDEMIDLLIPMIEPGSLVLDIGASLGFYTVPLGLAARDVGARVLAIEPVGRNCEIVRANVERNGLADVVSTLQCALGRAASTVTLHVEQGGTGNATVVTGLDPADVADHDRSGNTRSSETVRVLPLDDLPLPEALRDRRCSLVKIDAEGYEPDILAGAATFVARHRPVIFAEYNPAWLDSRGFPPTAPVDWASANGYSCLETTVARSNPLLDRIQVATTSLAGGRRTGGDLLMTPSSA